MLLKPGPDSRNVPLGSVIGETPEIQKIYQIIQIAARANHPVLIVGEPGTGKEVIARAIHSSSPRRHMPFEILDCSTLRSEDLEQQLHGLERGDCGITNFDRGTLFLDRIADLRLDLQGTVLRAIQQIESCGAHDGGQARLLAASTRDLHLAVAQGEFRRDLYFRLNALSLRVPPLRERHRDIPLLASSFLKQLSCAAGREYRFSDEALRAMLTYDWPGNVRELENCVERACCSAVGPVISLLDLPRSVSGSAEITPIDFPNIRVVPLSELEKRSIQETLQQVGGDKRAAARLLGIGKTTLYRKIREYETREQKREDF